MTDENVVDISTAKTNNAPKRKRRGPHPVGDWRDTICYSRRGIIEATVANAITILGNDPDWVGVFAWDEFGQIITTSRVPPWDPTDKPALPQTGEWADSDTVRAQAWLARHYHLNVGPACVHDAVRVLAEKKTVDPPKDWLRSLRWDGEQRIDTWLVAYLGASPSPYVARIGRWTLISAAARIMQPGCKVDTMLVLEGPQGEKKSTALRVLFGHQWFSDTPLELNSKDRFVNLRGVWCREFAELDGLGRAEIARVKSFLSSCADDFRPPYGRANVRVPRRCIFVGTINDSEYLRDATGNRRFWPVRCGTIDFPALERDREQLMAEAREMFLQGERWWPEGNEVVACEEAQADRMVHDAWLPLVGSFVEKQLLLFKEDAFVTIGDVLSEAIGIEKANWGHAEQKRAAKCLQQLKWVSSRRRRTIEEVKGQRVYGYVPPELSRVPGAHAQGGTGPGTGEHQ